MHSEAYVRTTLDLDDTAVAAALEAAPGRTKTDIINEALRVFARRRRVEWILDLRGKFQWEGDLDELRQRRRGRPRERS